MGAPARHPSILIEQTKSNPSHVEANHLFILWQNLF